MFKIRYLFKTLSVWVAAGLIASMTASNASAIFGEIVITPIESNIAAKFWVTASSDSGEDTAALAHDENPETAWMAGDPGKDHWLMLDLGGEYANLRKSEVVFSNPAGVYRYILEASTDGKVWDKVADRSQNETLSQGFVDLFTRTGTRFLRLSISGRSAEAVIGVKEWRVFNYLRQDIINGADMSYMDQLKDRKYYVNPNPQWVDMGAGPHVLDVVKDRGMKFIRLRIWNEPRDEVSGSLKTLGYCSPARSAAVAKWVKDRDLQLGIDFHYADSWADPGKQPKPKAWAGLEFDDLVTSLHDFTYDFVKLLVHQGTTPEKVAVGNEIINGFLWGSESEEMEVTNPGYVIKNKELYWSEPGGGLLWKYWQSSDPAEQQAYEAAWDRFSTLVTAGIMAVREASPGTAVEIHVVCEKGKLDKMMEFWQQLLTRVNAKGADPDVLAISYYPEWHGTYQDLEQALYAIASAYPQYEIAIAETAYPAEGGNLTMPNADQPMTVQGQANMLKRTIQAANDVINNQGTGVLVWEPQNYQPMFRQAPGLLNTYEPYASIDVYAKAFTRFVLEHNVYLTTFAGESPSLPARVQMLSMSTARIKPVPVTWEAIDPSLLKQAGSYELIGKTSYGTVTAQIAVRYAFKGFLPPVQNPPAENLVVAGKTVPLKFSLNGNQGREIFAQGYPASQEIACGTGSPIGELQPAQATQAGLFYSPYFQHYRYNWKTEKAWSNTCRQLVIKFTDGTETQALFRFK